MIQVYIVAWGSYFKFSFSLQELIKSSFQDIVSDELKKMKETPMKSCSETLSADAETSDDMIWEYDGIYEAYQGECEEILLEMQKIYYEDLENEQIGKGKFTLLYGQKRVRMLC